MAIELEASWLQQLREQFSQDYMQQLGEFLRAEKRAGKVIYPPGKEMFNAFNQTPLAAVKVVILGQDPYHGPGQAHGLCFSVALRPGSSSARAENSSSAHSGLSRRACTR